MALADFLSRRGISTAPPTGSMVLAGAAEVLEVGGAAALVGALEQRYGENKMTLFMTPQTDASGNVIKDANGNTQYKSGTGLPVSAAVAIGAIAISALVPMTAGMRRHLLNIGSGFGAGWGYRFGIAKGQAMLDKASGATSATAAPEPPYAQSASALAELANVKGEMGVGGGSVHSIVEQGNAIARQRAAMGLR